ncbi:MAG: branched-chain amino acid ABC transporter permease [Acidimicrobiia bacterium]|nr:branched-chain amino acid ABC transporter permease [Acidimicrobiia bacterium]
MGELVQVLVYAATIGSAYALVAFSYSLVFSTTRIINFAQGTLVVVGGYLAWWLWSGVFDRGTSMLLVVIPAVVLAAIVGLVFDLVAIEPLGDFDPTSNIAWLVTTFGAAIVVQEVVAQLISDTGESIPDLFHSLFGWQGSVVQHVAIGPSDVVLVVATGAIVGVAAFLQARTKVGRAFRAVAQDRQAAALMGINPKVMVRLSFLIAGAITGLAGILIAPNYGVRFAIGLNLGLAGFVAAVLGGLGSTSGAIVGGYAVGLVEGFVGVMSSRADTYRPIAVFVVFVLVLTLRPTGLLGRPVVEKV